MNIASGILSLLFGLFALMQSLMLSFAGTLSGEKSMAQEGSMGVGVALLLLIAGAFAFKMPKVAMYISGAAAGLGFLTGLNTDYKDMVIWGIIAGALSAMDYFSAASAKQDKITKKSAESADEDKSKSAQSEGVLKVKKALIWGGIALIVIVVIAAVAGGGGSKKETADKGIQPISTSEPSTKTEAKTEAETKPETSSKTEVDKVAKVGEALTVGEVKWIAGNPEKTSTIESGNEFINPAKANGVFIIVPLTAELIGKESGTIDSSQLAIVDSNGRRFKATDNSDVFVILGNASIFMKQVNPNVPVNGKAVFDVAPDATGLKLEVKDLRLLSNEKGYIDLGL